MKLVTLVGVRGSGKTTTVTELVKAIRRRGQTVGTCKSIGCPAFSIDQKGSNTRRHMLAGANLVCARGKRETSFIQRRRFNATTLSRRGCPRRRIRHRACLTPSGFSEGARACGPGHPPAFAKPIDA